MSTWLLLLEFIIALVVSAFLISNVLAKDLTGPILRCYPYGNIYSLFVGQSTLYQRVTIAHLLWCQFGTSSSLSGSILLTPRAPESILSYVPIFDWHRNFTNSAVRSLSPTNL
uniref:Secreted protein n=1 Tax=Amphimedon queenslandica TaxID=400682 RepID=A0A1X7TSQ3_AMPQE